MMSRLILGSANIRAKPSASDAPKAISVSRGIPLYFDVTAFQPEDLDARILEFLLDGGYLRRGDFLLLTMGSTAGEAGKTNQMKILTVE